MPGLDREAVYAALLTKLQGVASLTGGVSRRVPKAPPGPAEQPCAFLEVDEEVPDYASERQLRWRLHLSLLVYAQVGDPAQAPISLLAPIVKDIETALQWVAGDNGPINIGGSTTLGLRSVSHCVMTRVRYGDGREDGQGIAFILIEILAVSP
jgi:hypothetical protein